MKQKLSILLLILLLTFSHSAIFAQVGINSDNSQPDPSAMLDVKSANQGFLIPRVALISADSPMPLNTPVTAGLLVYNMVVSGSSANQVEPGFYYWNGSRWLPWATPQGSIPGGMLIWNGTSWVILSPGLNQQKLIFCNGYPEWGGCLALLVTSEITNITKADARSGGNVTNNGGTDVVSRGVCWSTNPGPTILNFISQDGSGSGEFISLLAGLTENTQYYVRAYAINSKGVSYGNEFIFITEASVAPNTTLVEIHSCPASVIEIPVITDKFENVGGFNLTLEYDSSKLFFTGITNLSGFPGFSYAENVPQKITITGHSADSGITLPDSSVLFSLNFQYQGDTVPLRWITANDSCVYFKYPSFEPLPQSPVSSYYSDGLIKEKTSYPVSVSISSASGVVCEGTSVSFSADPFNGGDLPLYQWHVNDTVVSGATNSNFNFIPSDNDSVSCSLTSSLSCTTGNPAMSNKLAIEVSPALPLTVQITPSATSVCDGVAVSFDAMVLNGGFSPTYQWRLNNADISGATNSYFQFTPVNNDSVDCIATSSDSCSVGSPAYSNTVGIGVNPILPVSVSIQANDDTVCAGTTVAYQASVINGGVSPSFQWRVDGADIPGATEPVFNYTPTYGNIVSCEVLSSEVCCSNNPALSNSVAVTVNPLQPVGISISTPLDTVCAAIKVLFESTVVNGGITTAYNWKINGLSVTSATNSSYSYMPDDGDTITCILTSNVSCATNNPATSNAIVMTVIPLKPTDISVSVSANPICMGSQVLLTTQIVNGGDLPAFQWQKDELNIPGANDSVYVYVPSNNDHIRCILTSSVSCPQENPSISNIITMTVTPHVLVGVSITASANPVCAGTPVSFMAHEINGGDFPAYQWVVNGLNVTGATSSVYSYTPENNDIVKCVLTSSIPCGIGGQVSSNQILMNLNPLLPVDVSVTTSMNPVCAGNQVTCTAVATNGGSHPTYQWRLNGLNISGATDATYTFVPDHGASISCMLTSNETCAVNNPAFSNPATISVNPLLPVGVAIESASAEVCAGTALTFSATPTNGGTLPAYQWKVNGQDVQGATSSTYTYIPGNGDVVSCVLSSSEMCVTNNPATSNLLTITVNPLLPVEVLASVSGNPVCIGTPVLCNVNVTNGGTSPTFQWRLNGLNVQGATNSAYNLTPASGDAVACVVTSNALCAVNNPDTSNILTIVVKPYLPVSISVAASANPVCAGTSPTFNASPVNGGLLPVYQWYVNGTSIEGATNSTFTYIPVHNDNVWTTLTSSELCHTGSPATSNQVKMSVAALQPVSVSITSSTSSVCAGATVLFSAMPVNGGGPPQFQWTINNLNVTGATNAFYSYPPAAGDTIRCIMTSSIACTSGNPATSNAVAINVTPLSPVSVTIAASLNPVCAGSPVTFTAISVNGGSAPAYQWRVNGTNVSGATNPTYTFTPTNNQIVTCILTSNIVCTSGNPAISNAIAMSVNPLLPVSLSIAASANPVCAGDTVTYTATTVNGGTSPLYQWSVNGQPVTGATNSTYTFVPVHANTVRCKVTSNAVCPISNPANSNVVTMTVNPIVPVSVTIASNSVLFCSGASAVFTATPINGGTTPAYQWFLNDVLVPGATNNTYSFIPNNSDVVKCRLTSSVMCTTGNPAMSNNIPVTVNPTTPVSATVSASTYAVMPGSSVTFTVAATNGGTSPTYQWKVNNVSIGTNSSTYSYAPSNNDNIYCTVTSSLTSCLSNNPASSNTANMIVYTTGTPCTEAPTVVYGGKTYNTVKIGTQCWLRENINYGTRIAGTQSQANNSIVEKYCYNNNDLNCNVYGGMYQWAEMVQYLNGVTNSTHWTTLPTAPVQGVCPPGWHIPTNTEATTLITTLGGQSVAGGPMKETGVVHWSSPNVGATNTSGFTALPCGYAYNGLFGNLKSYGFFWTTTKGQYPGDAYYFGAPYNYAGSNAGQSYKITGYPVRCLKN